MRFFILIIIAFGFIYVGSSLLFFGIPSMMSRHVSSDDIKAALLIGIMLEIIGGLVFWAALRVRKAARAAGRKIGRGDDDGGQLAGTLMGMTIGSDMGDDYGDDYGGDFGD